MWLVPMMPIDLDAVTTNVPLDDAPLWASGTTYAIGARVLRGAVVYQSTIASNLGNDPALEDQESDAARWLEVEFANAYAPFDGVLYNRSEVAIGNPVDPALVALGVPSTAAQVLDVPGVNSARAVVLFGVDAVRVQITALSASGVKLFQETRSATGRLVANYWDYFKSPLEGWIATHVWRGLPAGTARVIIALEGQTVRLGEVVIGEDLYLGSVLVDGTAGGYVTASRYEFNDFGRLKFAQRPSRRRFEYAAHIPRAHFDKVERLIMENIGVLVACVGSEDRQTTINFGIMTAPEWLEDDPDSYTFKFTIEGVS